MNFNSFEEELSNSLAGLDRSQNPPERVPVPIGFERGLMMQQHPSTSSHFTSIWGRGNGLVRETVEPVDIPRRTPASPRLQAPPTPPGSSMSSDRSRMSWGNHWWERIADDDYDMSGPRSSPVSGTSSFSMDSSPFHSPPSRRALENERSGSAVEGSFGWLGLGQSPPLSFPASGSSHFDLPPGQPRMDQSFSPSVAPRPQPRPRLIIAPSRSVNFAKRKVRFTVQATNLPSAIPLRMYRVEGVVTTPRGARISCLLTEVIKTDMFQMDEFSGWFWSTGEVGLYHLEVKLVLPWRLWAMANVRVIEEESPILILRNYVTESEGYSTSFQAEFESWPGNNWGSRKCGSPGDDRYSVGSKIWGIDCETLTNRLYYTDRVGNSLSCVDAESGQVIFKMSPSNSHISTQFNKPTGICCDMVHHRLIVADKDHHRICFFSNDGQYLASFGGAGHGYGTFRYPWGVAISPDGNRIAVTDSRNKRLQLFDLNGQFLDKFSVIEDSPYEYMNNFEYPRGVTFNRDGSLLYVSDFNTHNILEIPLDLKSYRRILPEGVLRRPQGLAVDSLDSLLLCDSRNNCIRHVWPVDGQRLSEIRKIGGEKLAIPMDLAVMGDDRLAVIDSQAKIRIF